MKAVRGALTVTLHDPATSRTFTRREMGTQAQVRAAAEKAGLTVIDVQDAPAAATGKGEARVSPLSLAEKISFCRSMAIMTRANMSVADALRFYGEALPAGRRNALMECSQAVLGGADLGQALERSRLFDHVFVGTVKAASTAGVLPEALSSLGERYRTQKTFLSKIRRAVALPVAAGLICLVIYLVGQLNLIPMVESMLEDAGAAPDPFSAIVFAKSHFIRATWLLWLGGFAAFLAGLAASPQFRSSVVYVLMSRFKSVRTVVMGLRQLTLLSTLRVLYKAGVAIVESLELAADALKGTAMREEVLRAAADVRDGVALASALRNHTSCEEKLVHMIRVSEGRDLNAQLGNLEQMFQEDTDDALEKLALAINIGTYLVGGGLITVTYLATVLPMILMSIQMMNAIK